MFDHDEDWLDDYMIMEMMNDDEKKGASNQKASHNGSPKKTKWGLWIPLLYWAMLLPGDIPANLFTLGIGVILLVIFLNSL